MSRGARRILTAGAAGSHQALATALFAAECGLRTAAVLCPQPYSEHAERTLRAAVALGLETFPVGSMAAILPALARLRRRSDYVVLPGGAGVLGALGYLRAVRELVEQIRNGELAEPDVIVAPVGSGGTVAGLVAGVVREGLRSRVIGISVATSRLLAEPLILGQAWAATRRDDGSAGPERLRSALLVDDAWIGKGYGFSTPEGRRAIEFATRAGIELDPTYTAKAFAATLALVGTRGAAEESARLRQVVDSTLPKRALRVLYWHTLSATELGGRPGAGRPAGELKPELQALLVRDD